MYQEHTTEDKDQQQFDTQKILDAIDGLTTVIIRRTSLKHRFASGIVTGIATVIGATVLAGAILFVVGSIIQQIDFSSLPYLQELIHKANLG